ncbi:hypothetical protein, partial [Acinetobacter indicus]|uniref:hypothetical protein n=1 Tax=Acinetobacter indicus TaxID=756892 RepID=UPI001C09B91C
TTYPSYALNLAQLGALCISNLCATKPICFIRTIFNFFNKVIIKILALGSNTVYIKYFAHPYPIPL